MRDVDDDAIEVRGQKRFASKGRQRAEKAKKNLLRQIFDVVATADEAHESAKDHRLMIEDYLFEAEANRQRESD